MEDEGMVIDVQKIVRRGGMAYPGSQGLAQAMVSHLQANPKLQGLRRWILFTRDAHEVYARSGWEPLDNPDRAMKLDFPDAFA